MTQTNQCPHCGKPAPAAALGGLCPECMLKAGLATQSGEAGPNGTVLAQPASAPPPAPSEIAKYFPQLEILECLGRGGMGVVYKARQPALNRLVALKVLAPEKERDPAFAGRFQREAQALAHLNHPSIVTVYDFGQVDGLFFLLMEYVDGLSLRQLLQTGKILPEHALTVVPKICEALQFAHEHGVVHRDIKPENVLLDQEGHVKIADFGIAKMLGHTALAASLTQDKQVMGTPHYMAPEQVEKPALVDHRADIYSLGVVFYEMLTGELPLGRFAPPSQKVEVDVRLDEVVLHALEKEPHRRYQQAHQVKTDVEAIAAGAPPTMTTRPSNTAVPPENVGARIPGVLWIAIISLGLMIVGKLIATFKVGPTGLVGAVLSGALLGGLIVRAKWAYVLTMASCAHGVFAMAKIHPGTAVVTLLVDALVFVPVLICTRHFFPPEHKRREAWLWASAAGAVLAAVLGIVTPTKHLGDLISKAGLTISQPAGVPATVGRAVQTISRCVEGDSRVDQALNSLRGLDQTAVVSALAPQLDSSTDTVRRSAIYILWKGGFGNIEPAAARLQALLDHHEMTTRGMAALALGQNKVAASYEALAAMAEKDSSGYARRCAAYALGLLGDTRAEEVLKRVLEDLDPLVKANASAALDMLRPKRPTPSP
ncbi:MAG: protein kinase [Verrucomicrobia bacterium]|nr:protein kinase [Verrucomicrobiota bacterium]